MPASNSQSRSVIALVTFGLTHVTNLFFVLMNCHCGNHKVNRNYQIKIAIQNRDDVNFVKEISAWLYSFVTYIETCAEANDSMTKLMAMIEAVKMVGDVSKLVIENTISFIDTKFKPELYVMGNWKYMGQWSGWVSENCFTEGSNGSLAKDTFGPKPKHRLHQAADCVITHTDEVYRKVGTEAHKIVQQKRQPRRNKAEIITDTDRPKMILSADIIPKKNDQAFEQYSLAFQYKYGEVCEPDLSPAQSPTSVRHFWVKSTKEPNDDPGHPRPIYRRIRTVTVKQVTVDNHQLLCISCTCSGLHFEKHACRHMYALLRRLPSLSDFMPECFKSYETTYDTNHQYTDSVDRLRLNIQNCGGLLFEPSIGNVGTNVELAENMPIFDKMDHNVVDVNPRSKAMECNEQVQHKYIGNMGPIHTKVCGPHSGYATVHPLFAHVMEQCKQQINVDAVKDALYSVLGVILEQNTNRTLDDDKQKDKPPLKQQETSLLRERDCVVRSISHELAPGSIFTTPALDTRNEHKRQAPGGSPSRKRRHKRKES